MRRDIDGFDIETFDIGNLLASNGMIDDYFYYLDVKNRRLTLKESINVQSVDRVSSQILKYNAEDRGKPVEERQPILLYLTSDGGDVDSGFELIDVIENSKTPVYIINLAYCYSMGFIIYLSGHKRFASKNAKFMIHDGSSSVSNSGGKAQDTMAFITNIEKRIKEYILSKTTITPKEYTRNLRKEWYMFADEAKAKGLVDAILGEDIDIDSIS